MEQQGQQKASRREKDRERKKLIRIQKNVELRAYEESCVLARKTESELPVIRTPTPNAEEAKKIARREQDRERKKQKQIQKLEDERGYLSNRIEATTLHWYKRNTSYFFMIHF